MKKGYVIKVECDSDVDLEKLIQNIDFLIKKGIDEKKVYIKNIRTFKLTY